MILPTMRGYYTSLGDPLPTRQGNYILVGCQRCGCERVLYHKENCGNRQYRFPAFCLSCGSMIVVEVRQVKGKEVRRVMGNIWSCKIGEVESRLPSGSDGPLRQAVANAYRHLTGQEPDFILSGWSAQLTESERACVEDRMSNEKEVRRVAPKKKGKPKKPARPGGPGGGY